MDYTKRYKKLRKKYHMKKVKSKSYVIVYLALIYFAMVINAIISFFKLKDSNIDKFSLFMNVPYILIVLILSIISFVSFFKSKENKKELIYIILTMIISLAIVPYLFSNLILVVIIIGILTFAYIFISVVKAPTGSVKKTNTTYSKEPIILKYEPKTEIYRKGMMVYKKNSTGEDSICTASAFDNGNVIIMIGNNKVSKIN